MRLKISRLYHVFSAWSLTGFYDLFHICFCEMHTYLTGIKYGLVNMCMVLSGGDQ